MNERFVKFLNIYDEFKEGTALRDVLNDAIRCYRHSICQTCFDAFLYSFYLSSKK